MINSPKRITQLLQPEMQQKMPEIEVRVNDKIHPDHYIHEKCTDGRCEDAIYVMRRRGPQLGLIITDINHFLTTENMRANGNHENYVLYID